MAEVSSLWIGESLSLIHKISLASFVYYGHKVKLYVYDLNLDVPDGIVKADARDILPESKIFYHHNQLAAFSDMFRYQMIKKTGEMWVDADTLCLSEYFFEDVDFVFIRQSVKKGCGEEFAGGILKMPQEHPIVDELINDSSEKISNGISEWSDIGPMLLTTKINKYGLHNLGIDDKLVNMFVFYEDSDKFWDPQSTKEILDMSTECYSATFFAGGLTARGKDKNSMPAKSAIEYFYNKFIL